MENVYASKVIFLKVSAKIAIRLVKNAQDQMLMIVLQMKNVMTQEN